MVTKLINISWIGIFVNTSQKILAMILWEIIFKNMETYLI